MQPDSFYYDKDHPEKNDSLVTFAQREKQMRTLHSMGAGRLYMHLDGWAQPGYDNAHPDYLPACQEAGGWEGMKSLVDACHEQGDIFGTHDQYRDYYFTAQTFDANNAIRLADGTMPEHARWAGGHQTYLCAELAPDYVAAISPRLPRMASSSTVHTWMFSPATKATNARTPNTA